jgi:hypothetical protein
MAYLQIATNLATQGYGVGNQSYGLDVMPKLDRLQVFLMSYMAPTEIIADKVKTKFPFWLNHRELSVFEDLTPDARTGGFGPLYGAFLILAVASFGFLFLGKAPNLASCFPLVPVLLSVSLTQTWWARWAPQGWLIPLCFILPALTCFQKKTGRKRWWIPSLAVFAGLLNSGLILLFYSVGCVKAQRVLESQLSFLKKLPAPLRVQMPYFMSNRIWLIRNGLAYELQTDSPALPRMKLKKTSTKIALPKDWQILGVTEAIVSRWRKDNLLEE